MAKEVLQKQDLAFSNRSVPNTVHALDQHQYAVVWLPVLSRWRTLPKITTSNIFTRNRLDTTQRMRQQKVAELVYYARKCGREVMLGSLLNSLDWKLDGGIKPEDLDIEEKFGMILQKAQPLFAVPVQG
ncbi:Geraniol 8-hydroxylase [Camellia lanceoleosa]|uniref:Geraniol 8-hydroxylase n=1 Tax=Camellia lanceoleosa TaxID=1840588 RepID=A0ACC0IDN0_9ERIC|nr:Geraniol 8-hydroxylase [Camellia lanceoleosa]